MIKVKVEKGGFLPTKKTIGSSCYDLYAGEDCIISPKNWSKVSLNIRTEFDSSIACKIFDRSSIAARGVFISAGVIDSDYRGIWQIVFNNLGVQDFVILKGERIAQVMFLFLPEIGMLGVEELGITERNEGGFGSTGIK